ncbi:jg3383 [Pararge aegeria aegeria]|uniref:Jg3383 protein n=1 Tax=Pararge aegeria aegeria TaxID=348720 RepID=A0A8S4RQQ0_9NEOP|nr:jg3383 [Pararge aegeria aegeria]
MFESDDYDQVLSQLDFPEAPEQLPSKNLDVIPRQEESLKTNNVDQKSPRVVTKFQTNNLGYSNLNDTRKKTKSSDDSVSPTRIKRKILNSYFDHRSQRKFPGPAGLLTGSFEEKKDENICQMELLSQDVDFTQNYIHGDVFETPLWKRLLEDTKSLKEINTIRGTKHQADQTEYFHFLGHRAHHCVREDVKYLIILQLME